MERSLSITTELALLLRKIHSLRRRTWQLAMLRGLARGVWLWLATLLAFGAFELFVGMPVPLRLGLLVTHGLLIAGGIVSATIGKRSLRNRNTRVWALRCEELFPALQNRLVTCIDLASEPGGKEILASSPVAQALLKETVNKFALFDPERAIPGSKLRQVLFSALLPVLLLLFLLLTCGDWTGSIMRELYHYEESSGGLIRIFEKNRTGGALTIRPGDVEVPRKSSVTIEAGLTGTNPANLDRDPRLDILEQGSPAQNQPMMKDGQTTGAWKMTLHQVMQPTRYQVTLGDLKSTTYKITPYDPPEIESTDSTITLPAYIHQPPKAIKGAYITGLTSSSVIIKIRANHPLASARLASAGKAAHEAKIEGQEATFELTLAKNESFKAELTDTAGHANLDPPMIQIHVEEDQPPTLNVKRPGADWSVHPLGEVILEAEAADDYGLRDVLLEVRVNDANLTTRTLYAAGPQDKPSLKQAASHTIPLETMGLQPGDVIYYRFSARDGQPDESRARSFSQPYFVTIRPFEQAFYKGEPMPPGKPRPPLPSQRQVIVATTRLADSEKSLAEPELRSKLADVARTQREIRLDSEKLLAALRRETDIPDLAARLAHMDKAIAEMKKAEGLLEGGAPREALQPELSALRHQTAALAGLPKYVAKMSGMESPFAPDPRMDLLGQKLELKKEKYELLDQPASEKEPDKKLVEALEKVRALARRQKEFSELIKREKMDQEQGRSGAGGSGGANPQNPPDSKNPPPPPRKNAPNQNPQGSAPPDSVRMEKMRQASDESRNELEKLRDTIDALAKLDPQALQEMKPAMDNMAQDLGKIDEALSKRDMQQAEGANARALDQLSQLELELEKQQKTATQEKLRELEVLARQWKEQQGQLKGATESLAREPQPTQGIKRQKAESEQVQLGSLLQKTADALANPAQNQPGQNQLGMKAIGGQPTPQDLEKLIRQAADWMNEASRDIGRSQDASAIQGQEATLALLDKIREAVDGQLNSRKNDPLGNLEKALSAVRALKESLQAQDGQKSPGDQGAQGKQDQGKQGKQGQGEQGKGQQGKEPNPSGQQGQQGQPGEQGKHGQEGQKNSPGQQNPQGLQGPQGGRDTASGVGKYQVSQEYGPKGASKGWGPTHQFTIAPRVMLLHLKKIEDLLKDEPRLAPIAEEVRKSAQELTDESWGGSESSQAIGEVERNLAKLEELLLQRLSALDQMQKLQQTPDEQIPPEFRDMAARYFEALGASEAAH